MSDRSRVVGIMSEAIQEVGIRGFEQVELHSSLGSCIPACTTFCHVVVPPGVGSQGLVASQHFAHFDCSHDFPAAQSVAQRIQDNVRQVLAIRRDVEAQRFEEE